MDADRTTSFGMWRYGRDFNRAAIHLLKWNQEPFMPYYFLVGQSIELSLKAFLLASNVPLKLLKDKYRHDLEKLLKAANEHDLASVVRLDKPHVATITLLNEAYRDRKFQYIETGVMYLPETELIQEASNRLSSELQGICYRFTHGVDLSER